MRKLLLAAAPVVLLSTPALACDLNNYSRIYKDEPIEEVKALLSCPGAYLVPGRERYSLMFSNGENAFITVVVVNDKVTLKTGYNLDGTGKVDFGWGGSGD